MGVALEAISLSNGRAVTVADQVSTEAGARIG
jgi:hypothetical protein